MFEPLRSLLSFLFLLACLHLSAVPGYTADNEYMTLVRQVQQRYQRLHSLECTFDQTSQSGSRSKEATGTARFYRTGTGKNGSGIMRWNYETPTKQTIINDGKELSMYTPDDRQMIITSLETMESDITYAILTGSRTLAHVFVIMPPDPGFQLTPPPAGLRSVQLLPKEPHPQVHRLQLWVGPDQTVRVLLMEDHMGALTELRLSAIRVNRLPAGDSRQIQALLELHVPPGTEIIRQ
ncbi:MAG: LolA family protein [Desulfobulbus sp.]|jgi:outer membrane lipoprotein carrier protein